MPNLAQIRLNQRGDDMEHQKEMAVGLGTTTTKNTHASFKRSKTTKLAHMLKVFSSGQSLNRFEAERYHDHCLNTTVSILQNSYKIQFNRVSETVPCLGGTAKVIVKRYWIDPKPENIQRARTLLINWGGQV
jgi:hypothetical protein